MAELYLHFPIRLHGVVLNQLSMWTTLPFPVYYHTKTFPWLFRLEWESHSNIGMFQVCKSVQGSFVVFSFKLAFPCYSHNSI
jgi:hypothetical protein